MTFIVVEEIRTPTLILIASGATLCLLSYIMRLVAHIRVYTSGRTGIDFRLILVVTFLGYFGWGYWSSADPVKMNIPSSVAISVGAPLATAGLGLFLYSELKKHGVGDADGLVTTGIYSKIRHPMYIGLVLLHLGFPFIAKSFIAFLSTILWASIIALWTRFEEMNLERRFGQRYVTYRNRTWF